MPTIIPLPSMYQGPQNTNVAAPRTPLPFAAGLTFADVGNLLYVSTNFTYVQPVPAADPVGAGSLSYTTFRDWYYRIHIVPTSVSLGNLSGDTTRQLLVWNAFFNTVSLESVVLENGDGILLNSPILPPADLGPLKNLVYTLNVSAEGPSVIDATLTWTIDGVDYVVPITGRRSVLFPYKPNWSDRVSEVLTWTTTVTRAWSGNEQRMSIAKDPRRSMRYSFQAKGEEARLLDALLFGWMGRMYSMPLWHEESRLIVTAPATTSVLVVDTTRMSIAVGSSVVVYKDSFTYEVVEVVAFSDSLIEIKNVLNMQWNAGTKVIPVLPALPQADIPTSRPVPHIAVGSVTWTIDPSSPINRLPDTQPPALYQGAELMLDETDWSKSLEVPYASNRRDIDNAIGPLISTRKGDYPAISRSFRWVCRDRSYADNLRAFFARRRGRLTPVWMPSGTEDFVLAEPVDPVAVALVVRKSQYGAMVWPSRVRRDLVIRLRNGQTFTRRIEAVAEGAEVTVLTLDQGFGEAFAPSDVRRISFLGLYRLANDSVTFNWSTNYVAVVETDFILTEPEQ